MTKNFMTLVNAVKEYPYCKTFKVADVYPGWDNLTEQEQKDLLREFAAFAWDRFHSIRIEDDNQNGISDFDFTYSKSLRRDMDEGAFNGAVKTALILKNLPAGREFTLPEMNREQGEFCSEIEISVDTEKTLNDIIDKGCVPFLKKVGQSHGFTIYKRL